MELLSRVEEHLVQRDMLMSVQPLTASVVEERVSCAPKLAYTALIWGNGLGSARSRRVSENTKFRKKGTLTWPLQVRSLFVHLAADQSVQLVFSGLCNSLVSM